MKISADVSNAWLKLTAIGLSKQEAFDSGPKVIQQNIFTRNLDHAGNPRMLFALGKRKENIFDFWQGTVKYSYYISCYKELHFRCAGIPWFASDIPNEDLSDRNKQFKFKQVLTRSMFRKS